MTAPTPPNLLTLQRSNIVCQLSYAHSKASKQTQVRAPPNALKIVRALHYDALTLTPTPIVIVLSTSSPHYFANSTVIAMGI